MVDNRSSDLSVAIAAFGDRPDWAPLLGPSATAHDRWLAAVVLGAQGRYAAACALLERVHADPLAPLAVRAHASVTRAAHLRQLGGHGVARRWDAAGLALATRSGGDRPTDHDDWSSVLGADCGFGPEGARLDALIGLAADAIGLGDYQAADRLLLRVERDVTKQSSWRPSVRLFWVRAELALSRQRPVEAVRWARRAVELSGVGGSLRHKIKSELVFTVADSANGIAGVVTVSRLNSLVKRVMGTDLRTLEWVVLLLLADQLAGAEPARSTTFRQSGLAVLKEVRRSSDPLGRRVLDLSPWVPDLG